MGRQPCRRPTTNWFTSNPRPSTRCAGAAETERNAGVLFLSSEYSLSLDERQPAAIEATYRVAVMPGPARSLWLRLRDVTLAGANACRVNGRPVPIRQDATGFVVTLDPVVPSKPSLASSQTVSAAPPQSASGSRRAIAAERPASWTDAAEPELATRGAADLRNPTCLFPQWRRQARTVHVSSSGNDADERGAWDAAVHGRP